MSFRVKSTPDLELGDKSNGGRSGVVPAGWGLIGVATGKDPAVFFELEPADRPDRIECGSFYIDGPFRIIRRVSTRSDVAWRAFEAE